MVFRPERRGHFRLIPTLANGLPSFVTYQLDVEAMVLRPLSIQLIVVDALRICEVDAFLDPSLCALFGMPHTLATR